MINKQKTKKVDQLNDYSIVDPQLAIDILPQPFLSISQSLEDDILKQVFKNIHQIEKDKLNSNYDGKLRQLTSQYIYDQQEISFLGKPCSGILLAGDRMGNVILFDITKKNQLCKKQISPGHRITYIDSFAAEYIQSCILTIAILARGDPKIHIFRIKKGQYRFMTVGTILLGEQSPKTQSLINQFPYTCQFSLNGQFLAIICYSGNILIYQIPQPSPPAVEVNKIHQEQIQQQQNSPRHEIPKSYQKNTFQPQHKFANPLGQIKSPIIKVPKPFKQTFQLLKKSKLGNTVVQQKKQQKKKDSKKDTKATVASPQQVITKPILYNQIQNQKNSFDQFILDKAKDVSKDLPQPKIKPVFKFISQPVMIVGPAYKILGINPKIQLTTKFIISHTLSKDCCQYKLQQANINNVPKRFLGQIKTQNQPKRKFEFIKKTNFIYKVTTIAISKDSLNIAVGLQDGTIVLLDSYSLLERFYLERHKTAVTIIQFFQSRVISGSKDGSILLHDIINGKTIMKRVNMFKAKKQYSIVNLLVCQVGLAFAIDTCASVKVYDLWRGQKVCRLVPLSGQLPGTATKEWTINPSVIAKCSDNQVLIASNSCYPIQQTLSQQQLQNKNKVLQRPHLRQIKIHSFRIIDILLQTFDGLNNIYKKGYDRNKIISCFSHLQTPQLLDKYFQIPVIGGSTSSDPKISQLSKSKRQSSLSLKSSSGYSQISSGKNSPKKKQQLTQQKLHPQRFLFTRKNIKYDTVERQDKVYDRLKKQMANQGKYQQQVRKGLQILRQDINKKN